MIELLVLADDFTGALDAGVQFAKQGIYTLVKADTDNCFEHISEDVQVLVVDTETRHLKPKQAAELIACIARKAFRIGVPYVYKKTDSALRGNIGSELDALLSESKETRLLFIPAFPQNGRTTRDGVQYYLDVPISDTVLGEDPFTPVCYSHIPTIIKQQSNVKTVVVAKHQPLQFENGSDKTIYIFDGETNEDLSLLCDKLKVIAGNYIFAGSAGFAQYLAKLIEFKITTYEKNIIPKNVLVISGSLNPITVKQINNVKTYGAFTIVMTNEQKFLEQYYDTIECVEFVDSIKKLVLQQKLAVISVAENRDCLVESDKFADIHDILPEKRREIVANNIGRLAQKFLQVSAEFTPVIFGGDTLISIVRRLGCSGIHPIEEIAPGIVLSRVELNGNTLHIITKSGGFGGDDIIYEICRYLDKL